MDRKSRRIVDISMVILLPLLMGYSLIGETFHEAAGTAMLVLVILHLVQNMAWFKSVLKGKYSLWRIFQLCFDLVLLVLMVVQPVTGILMSKKLYTFIHIQGIAARMRQIHMVLAYWCFVLLNVHSGSHLWPVFQKVMKKDGIFRVGVITGTILLCFNGARAFVSRQLPSYLFRKTMFAYFDYSENRIFFLADYFSIMILFAMLGMCLAALLINTHRKR